MDHEKELAEAGVGLDKALGMSSAEAAALASKAGGLDDICKIYRDIRPWLERIIKLLELAPISWGKALAKALRVLMAIADSACPVVG